MSCYSQKKTCDPKKDEGKNFNILTALKDVKSMGYIAESKYSKDSCTSSSTPLKSLEYKLLMPMGLNKSKDADFIQNVKDTLRKKKALYTEIAVSPNDRFYAGGDFYDAKKCATMKTN